MDKLTFHLLRPVCSTVWVFTFNSLEKSQVLALFKSSCVDLSNWMIPFSAEYDSFLTGSLVFALFNKFFGIVLMTR